LHDDGTIISLSRRAKKRSNCLGADDTVGVALALHLIEAGIPGRYVFHTCEEHGGIGSSDLATYSADILADIKMAIAFDRRGTTNVITHQSGGRCCSEVFASALADQLNASTPGFAYAPSDRGIFTDTANYTHLIPECTNISVGYYQEHTPAEHVDTRHVARLADALTRLDLSTLPIARNPNEDAYWKVADVLLTSSKQSTSPKRLINGMVVDTTADLDRCLFCGEWYSRLYSDAQNKHLFCDRFCERCYWHDVDDDAPRKADSVYLDPTVAEVQSAIAAEDGSIAVQWREASAYDTDDSVTLPGGKILRIPKGKM